MGSNSSKAWDKYREDLVGQFSLSKCRAEFFLKKIKNEIYSLYQTIRAIKGDASVMLERSIYQEHNLKVVESLIKILEFLIQKKHLLNGDFKDNIGVQVNTIIYCSYKLDIDELNKARNIFYKILGRKYCVWVLNSKENVEKNVLLNLSPKVPSESDIKTQFAKVIEMFGTDETKLYRPGELSDGSLDSFGEADRDYEELMERFENLKN